MSVTGPPGEGAETNGQQLPQRVAELAGELTEAEEETRRRRLARQIAQLAGRSRQATVRGPATRPGAAWQGVQSAARRLQPATAAAGRRVRATGAVTTRRVLATGAVTRKRAEAGGATARRGVTAAGDWLTAQVVDMAPRVPIRDLATLRKHYPGLDTEQLAEQLIGAAARASAGIGVAIGAAAAVPFVPTMPVELGVETLALVAVELKLVAELHEVYGRPAPGTTRQRMLAYLTAWSQRRGVRLTSNGIALAVGTPVRRQLERRLLAKAGQSAFAFAPLLTGAVAGAVIDHHETRRLGHLVRNDLRKRAASERG